MVLDALQVRLRSDGSGDAVSRPRVDARAEWRAASTPGAMPAGVGGIGRIVACERFRVMAVNPSCRGRSTATTPQRTQPFDNSGRTDRCSLGSRRCVAFDYRFKGVWDGGFRSGLTGLRVRAAFAR